VLNLCHLNTHSIFLEGKQYVIVRAIADHGKLGMSQLWGAPNWSRISSKIQRMLLGPMLSCMRVQAKEGQGMGLW